MLNVVGRGWWLCSLCLATSVTRRGLGGGSRLGGLRLRSLQASGTAAAPASSSTFRPRTWRARGPRGGTYPGPRRVAAVSDRLGARLPETLRMPSPWLREKRSQEQTPGLSPRAPAAPPSLPVPVLGGPGSAHSDAGSRSLPSPSRGQLCPPSGVPRCHLPRQAATDRRVQRASLGCSVTSSSLFPSWT